MSTTSLAVAAADSTRDRDPCSLIHRVTRENRHLWYQLLVIQQPERARACGAGTKANSDRRPVDPPPVVELRIKEGASFEEGKDITFDYNASFFLYASLEQHRKIAPGRMQGQHNPPILTGVPASGMAYLDRPSAAGYFIFPDLSVRHEGQYHLSFSLFEATKEDKDLDLEPVENNMATGVDWRMDIQTSPFDVYSAKKFPGLMESTQLSKDVAEQGCRVRIRRDVRMRKREGKSSRHSRRDDDAQVPRHRTVTPASSSGPAGPASEDPHAAAARARSISNSSEHRIPYGVGMPAGMSAPSPTATTPGHDHHHPHQHHHHHQRRPSSIIDGNPGPPTRPPLPHSSSQAAYEQQRHLSFGDQQQHGALHYAAPAPVHQAPPPTLGPVSPGGPYTPTTSQYPSTYPPAAAAAAAAAPHHPHPQHHGHSHSHHGHSHHNHHDGISSRRTSSATTAYMPPSPSVYSHDGGHQPPSHGRLDSYPHTPGMSAAPAPPILPPAPLSRMHSSSISSATAATATSPSSHQQLAPLKIERLVSPMPVIEPQTEPMPEPQAVPTGGKRKHDIVFHQSLHQPLHNRQRQLDPHYGGRSRGLSPDPQEGAYSRADGTVGVITFNRYS
ncbi:Velvet factor [Geosmithia morbida]|uniref:Velvet factor n=1 Tax=Geosmithia morbida TaxID=1094350 RepID=A0A9P5D4M8_9HYPO|nr:Velvet factor [Geosmithia morbida]KAF4123706.1 Velvet factor [Geosmithia morbida]